MRITVFLLAFFITFGNAYSQVPAGSQSKSILLLDVIAHLGNGKTIPRAAVGFRDGKIDMVLDAFDARMDTSNYDTIIRLPKKHLYPGFIAANSRLGLVEIDAVRATKDYDDVGLFNPHVRALTAYNTASRITSTVRTNGVLYAQVSPKGGIISGSSSVFALDGWNWEDAVLKADDGIHMNWPNEPPAWMSDKKQLASWEKRRKEQLLEIEQFFEKAYAYSKKEYHIEKDLRFEAMRSVFKSEQKIYLHEDKANAISDAAFFLDKYPVKWVLVGGAEAWLIADILKDRSVPVLLRRVHSLPYTTDENIHLPFQLPAILQQKGLLVGLQNSGSMEAMGTRNLPFYAGTAVAYGLDKESALSMISYNVALILGLENRIGSIEIGKDASFFISEGDALDMKGNQVIMAFIAGRAIDLNNPQKELYKKYKAKYEN